MAVTDSNVQIQPDSTGKRVRTYEILQIISDGTAQLVELQGVIILDKKGIPVDWQDQMFLLTNIRDLLQELVNKE